MNNEFDEPIPHRSEVQKILAVYFHDPEECWNEDEARYELSWETEYDEGGFCTNDIVEELSKVLPPGWVAGWTGNGGGEYEDFYVEFVR